MKTIQFQMKLKSEENELHGLPVHMRKRTCYSVNISAKTKNKSGIDVPYQSSSLFANLSELWMSVRDISFEMADSRENVSHGF